MLCLFAPDKSNCYYTYLSYDDIKKCGAPYLLLVVSTLLALELALINETPSNLRPHTVCI